MEHLSKYVWIDIIEYINFNHLRVRKFRNYALVNKKTFLIAKEYLSYKKRQFKLYNTPKTHKNCLYRLKVTYSSYRNCFGEYIPKCRIEGGGFVCFMLEPSRVSRFAVYEFIILIQTTYYSSKNELYRINFIVIDGPIMYRWGHSTRLYPGVACINELLDENFICFY
tara:strand:+ start:12 stop:512 length:501 start_codon:yes stop_codon:yes gene_type:complete